MADRCQLDPKWLRPAAAPGLVPISLQLDELGQAGNQLRDPARLVIDQPRIGNDNGIMWLAKDMRLGGQREVSTAPSSGKLAPQVAPLSFFA
jgi:hypothetical protein